ncbi:MAG: type II toxin-antitoxin system HicB family antitoxin [Armatimonadetes bacterium]|nr:type II toxin-antitoxin system HicB family antitoxin [Armatimonadota bacterium]
MGKTKAEQFRYPVRMWQDEDQEIGVEVAGLGPQAFLVTHGHDWDHAREMAREILTLHLEGVFERGFEAPAPPASLQKDGQHWEWVSPAAPVAVAFAIRKMRRDAGLTQGEAAARVGKKQATWQRWENPRLCNAELKTLEEIAQSFGRQLEVAFK